MVKISNDDPAIRMLMGYPKGWLEYLCKEKGLSTKGQKINLSERIAEANSEQAARDWDAISNGA